MTSFDPSSSPPRGSAGELLAAQAAWRPLRRAVRYATFDAWTLAIFGGLSLLSSGGGVAGVLLGLVLGGTAYVEFRAVARLRQLDPAAPRRLAANQLALGAGLVLYAAWNLYLVSVGRGMLAELVDHQSDLGDFGPQAADLFRSVLYILYGVLALFGVLVPGATAWFYATRTGRLQGYLSAMPPWIVQMQRAGGRV